MTLHHLSYSTSVLQALVSSALDTFSPEHTLNMDNVIDMLIASDHINYDPRYQTFTWIRRPLNPIELRHVLLGHLTNGSHS